MANLKTVALEESTNTHQLSHVERINKTNDFTEVVVDENEAVITHGEHGTMRIESKYAVVYRQNEHNPVTKSYQKVVD